MSKTVFEYSSSEFNRTANSVPICASTAVATLKRVEEAIARSHEAVHVEEIPKNIVVTPGDLRTAMNREELEDFGDIYVPLEDENNLAEEASRERDSGEER